MMPLPDETPVDDLELSVRAAYALRKLGIVTVGQIRDLDACHLLSRPNFGRKSLHEIREIIGNWPRPVNPLAKTPTADLIDELNRRMAGKPHVRTCVAHLLGLSAE